MEDETEMTTRPASSPTIIDTHQHFWDTERMHYAWMGEEQTVLTRTYLPSDLEPVLRANGVSSTVLVQAHSSVEEARWLLGLAEANDFIAGVVAWVDLTSPEVGAVLDELSTRPGLVGIRHQVHDEPDDAWLLRDDVVRGLREVSSRGLAYDLLLRPQHLKYVQPLADKIPDLRMVVDHIAKPLIASGLVESWAADIAAVAAIPGVYCKVSGMVTEADHASWTPDDLKPYVSHVVEHFGFDRLMYGSDWPVCLLAASYDQVMGAAVEVVAAASEADQAAFLSGNAVEFYGL